MNIRIALLPALLTAASIVLSSCSDLFPTAFEDDSLMPLAVGSQWVARVVETGDAGEEITWFDTITIVAAAAEGEDGTIYRDHSGMTWWNGSDGLYRGDWNCGGPLGLFPAERGDTFATTPAAQVLLPAPNGGEPEVVEQKLCQVVLATDTLITVPAGSFRCYHYTTRILAPDEARLLRPEHLFYAPGVGPVLIERWHSRGDNIYRWELTHYTITES